MTLRQNIRNNVTIWLLCTGLVGLFGGFAMYRTLVEVSNQVTVSKLEYETLKRTAAGSSELEKQIAAFKATQGRVPSGHRLNISSGVVGNQPTDSLSEVRLDQEFFLASEWTGVTANGYYRQRWQISNKDGLIAEDWFPFVPTVDGVYWTWASFQLRSDRHAPGKYRLQVFLNGRLFEDRELVVTDN